MKRLDRKTLFRLLGVLLLVVLACVSFTAMADVGNQNRYVDESSSSSDGDSDGSAGFLVVMLLSLLIENPKLGVPLLIIAVIALLIYRRKSKKGHAAGLANTNIEPQPMAPEAVVELIRQDDPNFSAEKFTAWVREVFLHLQQAWTERDWKKIRPFESEELFALHNAQLEEYIRNNKINVVEKIGIKSCQLANYTVDGDKDVLRVRLSAVMRDYVIDATTRKVLESDPNRDWNMRYQLTFMRKHGVKTQEGLSNKSTTNCPNCGAPTEITSAGQCSYCGSVITTGEHDWVLTDLHSI